MRAPGGESGVLLEQLGPCGSDHHERHTGRMSDEMLDEGQQCIIGPMQVLEDQDGGVAHRDLLDEAQPRGEVLVPACLRGLEAKQSAQTLEQPLAVLTRRHDGFELGLHGLATVALQDAGVGLEDLAERPEGDVLTVGQAVALAPGDRLGPRINVGEQLLHQTTLADAGLAEKHCKLGSRRGYGLLEQRLQERELHLTADQGRELSTIDVEPHARNRPLGQPSGHRLGLALGGDGGERLVLNGAVRELVGQGADGDAAGRSGRLEAGGDVDGIASEEAAARGGVDVEAHEGLAGVDADADLERGAVRTGHPLESLDDTQAGAHGSLRIVFVHGGHAEDADHGIADELLDDSAVGLDHLGGASEVLAEQAVNVLGIGGLAHRREGDEIADQGADDLALFGNREGGSQ